MKVDWSTWVVSWGMTCSPFLTLKILRCIPRYLTISVAFNWCIWHVTDNCFALISMTRTHRFAYLGVSSLFMSCLIKFLSWIYTMKICFFAPVNISTQWCFLSMHHHLAIFLKTVQMNYRNPNVKLNNSLVLSFKY